MSLGPCGFRRESHVFESWVGSKREKCKHCGITRLVKNKADVETKFVCAGDHAWIDSDLFPGKITCCNCGELKTLLPTDLLVDVNDHIDTRTTAQKIEEKFEVAKAILEGSKK